MHHLPKVKFNVVNPKNVKKNYKGLYFHTVIDPIQKVRKKVGIEVYYNT